MFDQKHCLVQNALPIIRDLPKEMTSDDRRDATNTRAYTLALKQTKKEHNN